MTTQIRSTSDQMALSRMFGHVNPDTYSPTEYANTLGPVLERRLRESAVRIANNYLEPHNSGVRLTLVFERAYTVRPGGRSPNEALVENGAASQQNHDEFVGGIFEMADKLTDITLVDALGNSRTFRRGDVKSQTRQLAESEDAPLDLSAFDEAIPLPFDEATGAKLGRGASYAMPKPTSTEKGGKRLRRAAGRALKRGAKAAGRAAGKAVKKAAKGVGRAVASAFRKRRKKKQEGIEEKLTWDVDRMGHVTITDTATKESVYVQGEEGQMLADELDNAPNERVEQMILDQYTVLFGEAFDAAAQGNTKLDEDVATFMGETADFAGAAEKLLADSEVLAQGSDQFHNSQKGLGYRAYLRQVVARKDPGYLTRSEDTDIKAGALRARVDMIDLAGSLGENREQVEEAYKGHCSVVPAYGRDYKNADDAVADFKAGKDFILMDITSPWDGKPANWQDLRNYYSQVNIRFNNQRDVVVVDMSQGDDLIVHK